MMYFISMAVLYRSSGVDLGVVAVDKHIDAARRNINMHFLLLRVSSEELSRPQIDVFVLDRPYVVLTRVNYDLLYGLLEGRSIVA